MGIIEEQYAFTQEKIDTKKQLTIYGLMAVLFEYISKEVVDTFGEKGEDLMREGVTHFGLERGQDIARRAELRGQVNNTQNYLHNYDMGRSDLFEYDTIYRENEIEQTFHRCPFGEQWKNDDMGEYGILYCQVIDPSIAKGYHSSFQVIHDQYIINEGICHFKFQLLDNPQTENKH
ncbi:hypothetical protein GMB86_09355 [Terrilactibacillus sp. BCM23-1]|uniref:L-2-amino-thiazoline-4-carboxylic acid hydrolase n=2 Tax=Terrilactibacillus tamarindi TaxID=2599694 RepID=A0A6N8CPU6_9BACI|nr:hypothetical protein [Terrilactibacillus tamarindi]